MGRAKPQTTKYPGVYKRVTTRGKVYDVAFREPGKKNPRWVRGKFTDLEAANKYRLGLLHDIHHGVPLDGRTTTLQDFVMNDWLPHQQARVADGKLRESTRRQYQRDMKNHILPALGSRPLAQINNAKQVEDLADALLRDGQSPDTARRVVNTLGYVLKRAKRQRLINYNPVEDAEKPSPRRRTPTLPTVEQVYRVADAAPSESRNLILCAAFTGIRISELFGLRWANVDLTEGSESVRIVEQFYKGEYVPQAKTNAGNREVILGPEAAHALRDQSVRQQVDSRPNPLGLAFPSPDGCYWRDSNFNRRVWQKAREAAGLPELTFHTLRYFFNSHIRRQGLAAAITEQIVGHTDERTHRGYTRPIPGTEQLIRQAQAGIFVRPEAS